jgi:hypothetical protein
MLDEVHPMLPSSSPANCIYSGVTQSGFEDDYRYEENKNAVVATWLISFQQICDLKSLAVDYVARIACVDHRVSQYRDRGSNDINNTDSHSTALKTVAQSHERVRSLTS